MPGYSIRLYNQRLFLVRAGGNTSYSGKFDFGLSPDIEIQQFNLRLQRRAIFNQLEIEDRGQSLSLRFRDQGRRNSDRHRLKRLFQKYRVPPWERSAVAQVYLDEKLAGLLP